ncbi:hypothetical protein FAGKG844_530004 [Frankia sp. AgKG'84/4]
MVTPRLAAVPASAVAAPPTTFQPSFDAAFATPHLSLSGAGQDGPPPLCFPRRRRLLPGRTSGLAPERSRRRPLPIRSRPGELGQDRVPAR